MGENRSFKRNKSNTYDREHSVVSFIFFLFFFFNWENWGEGGGGGVTIACILSQIQATSSAWWSQSLTHEKGIW